MNHVDAERDDEFPWIKSRVVWFVSMAVRVFQCLTIIFVSTPRLLRQASFVICNHAWVHNLDSDLQYSPTYHS